MQRSARNQSRRRSELLALRAWGMRRAPTPSEALLWEALRGGRLGVRFRRQVPIAGYIVDFFCAEAKLVVEVDGRYHAGRVKADARRDTALRRAGCTVVRVEAVNVVHHVTAAVARVVAALAVE